MSIIKVNQIQDIEGENPIDVFNIASKSALAGIGGASLIGGGVQVVDSVASIRSLKKTSPAKFAFATAHTASRQGVGSGAYRLDELDNTSADNNSTIIVATDGGRWKLIDNGVVTPERFGAAGDGIADDTAAVQAAFDSGARVVVLPQGKTYRWASNGPIVRSNTHVYGYGATIIQPSKDPAATISTGTEFAGLRIAFGSENIVIEGLDIRGPHYGGSVVAAYRSIGIAISGRYDQYFYNNPNYPGNPAAGFIDSFSSNITIKFCKINGFAQSGVIADQIHQFFAHDNQIRFCARDGIRMYGCVHFNVSDNFIRGLGPGMPLEGIAPNLNMYGIEATRVYHSPEGNGSVSVCRPSRFGVISRNLIRDVPGWKCMGTHGGTDIEFSNNICIDSHIGVGVDKGGFSASDGYAPPRRISIIGNQFLCTVGVGVGNRSAIFCVANDNTDQNIGEDLLISGNVITGPWGEDNRDGGIVVSNYRRVNLANNVITDVNRCGINFQQYVEDFSITGGVISNVKMTTLGTCIGISCAAANQRGSIDGVAFRKTDTADVMTCVSTSAPAAGYGVTVGSNMSMTGSVLRFNSLGIYLAPTSPFLMRTVAWANVNNSGTAASLAASRGIVASVTRQSIGVVRVVLSEAMSTSQTFAAMVTLKGNVGGTYSVNPVDTVTFDVYVRDYAGALKDAAFFIEVKSY